MHTLSLRGKFKFVLDEEFRFVYPLTTTAQPSDGHHFVRRPRRKFLPTAGPSGARVCVCVCGGRKCARPILQDDYIHSYITLLYTHTQKYTHILTTESLRARTRLCVRVLGLESIKCSICMGHFHQSLCTSVCYVYIIICLKCIIIERIKIAIKTK